jgi:DNA helicase II / ATP-dependent DNA helicase PcrA
MKQYLSNLNNQQEQAVKYVSGPLRVIAGAGSGKTKVLTSRICYLVDEIGVSSNKILAITFTNKAANEMKRRISEMIPGYSFNFITTFHSFCLRILREDADKLGISKDFIIMDEEDQKSLIKDIYEQLSITKEDLNPKFALDYISKSKCNHISPEQALAIDLRSPEELKSKIYDLYYKKQKSLSLLDFNDLIINVYKLFNSNSQVLDKWARRFQYILVDEFQDTDNIQYDIVKKLSYHHKQLFVVGDPDQTIYSWRGSNIELILNIQDDFPALKNIILDQNYRSTRNILAAANSLINNNNQRIKKDLFSTNEIGNKINYYEAGSDGDQAVWISRQIQNLIQEGTNPNTIAILYRSNYVSREIEQKLIAKSLPYKIFGGFKFYQRKEIKDAIAYLKAFELYDYLSIKRIINTPSRKISEETVSKVSKYADLNNITFIQALKEVDFISELSSIALNGIRNFLSIIAKYKTLQEQKEWSIIEKIQWILEHSSYMNMLNEEKKSTQSNSRIENINELYNSIEEFTNSNPDSTVVDFINEVSLYSSADDNSTEDSISLMTVHIAKGLEFDHVFIASLCDEIIPSSRKNENDEELEEERRVMYVALTRAKKQLFLSSIVGGFSYVTKSSYTVSRFVFEIDQSLIEISRPTLNKTTFSTQGYQFTQNPKINPKTQYIDEVPDFVENEQILHTVFGEGIILKVYGEFIEVAFKPPHNIKTLMAKHKSISKKMN